MNLNNALITKTGSAGSRRTRGRRSKPVTDDTAESEDDTRVSESTYLKNYTCIFFLQIFAGVMKRKLRNLGSPCWKCLKSIHPLWKILESVPQGECGFSKAPTLHVIFRSQRE